MDQRPIALLSMKRLLVKGKVHDDLVDKLELQVVAYNRLGDFMSSYMELWRQ
jgi:hypothetical protein